MDKMKKSYCLHDNHNNKLIGAIGYCNQRYFFPLSKEDLSSIKDWRNAQMDVLRQWKPLTDRNQENWYHVISEDNHQVIFSIKECNQDAVTQLIGYCGITNIDYINRRGEISFLVDPSRAEDLILYQLDIFAVLNHLCQYGFDRLNLHKLFTETFDCRTKHISLLEQFGMHLDGVIREHQYIRGKYHNSVIHSILQSEWNLIREV